MPFNNPLRREVGTLYGRVKDRLEEDLVYEATVGDGELVIAVPKGFVTDYASTPRILWPVFPPREEYGRAAIMHDYLYSTRGQCSRFLADALFRDAMVSEGVPEWKAMLMYYAVRAFGWKHWRAGA